MSSVDRSIHAFPTPEAVARLWASHGAEAVIGRYWYLNNAERSRLNRLGRVTLGLERRAWSRPRATTPEQESAAIEAAYAVGSMHGIEVAAGIRKNGVRDFCAARGLGDTPRISSELRGRLTRDSKDAARGDTAAAARIAARRRHAEQVYAVCLAALALVPDQPEAGRPRLPEPSPELAAALAGFDRDAVAAVFPSLTERQS
ncbi:hypothetical protein [Methylorubrum extorquens]|uniref:Uncharacterized protein n=1 Tax=Methylorubrum extorquens (strain ATCC 14718 / DSM 1338 / JCM 2805 / NCIMB 9133 / AM1) TaxID=272630 RepID=C5B663_METEA|nr:hypothetical protein [Methylorubrum extorquens]ACS43945.1 Hypothetical protein MexAM1_META2p1181 [Methylorubrum extorquens AM1]MCP1546202.1 hypothetical protein [Methylorubrum extorquens]MCP1590869.1 hypothetical protein [Methylorubrum extorquens]